VKLLARYDDDRHFRPGLMNQPHGFETVHPGHEDIDDEQVELLGIKQSQAGTTVVNGLDGMRRALEQDLDGAQDRPIVVNDENARHGFPW
jgi:hypothetical protein